MLDSRFQELVRLHNGERLDMSNAKSVEYAQGDDRLANFKGIAAYINSKVKGSVITPEMVCLIYMHKHFDSIARYVANGSDPASLTEGFSQRIADLQNYGDLLLALDVERSSLVTTDQLAVESITPCFDERMLSQ